MSAPALPAIAFTIQRATLAARQRTGDALLGVRVESGKGQICRVTPRGDACDVSPLSEWMPVAAIPQALDSL